MPDLAPEIVDLVQRCLAKSPQDRPHDGDELHRQLQQILLRLRDLKSLVDEAGCGCGWQQQQEDRRITLTVDLPHGRRQRVFIEERCDGPEAEPLVRIYSVCGPANEQHFRGALELNARIAHGSLALESIDGVPHFVMVNCYPRLYLRRRRDPPQRSGDLPLGRHDRTNAAPRRPALRPVQTTVTRRDH